MRRRRKRDEGREEGRLTGRKSSFNLCRSGTGVERSANWIAGRVKPGVFLQQCNLVCVCVCVCVCACSDVRGTEC